MSTILSTIELRNMTIEDLEREIQNHQWKTSKMRIDIELNKEKDSAKYRREKRGVARMKTILWEKITAKSISAPSVKEELKKTTKTRTVRAPKKS